MKTVSGKVLSSQSVSLSQAARTISAFVAADNGGASQPVAAYLKRTSAAFNQLLQFHKDLKNPSFKIKQSRPIDSSQDRLESFENGGEKKKKKQNPVNFEEDGGRKKEDKKKELVDCGKRGSEGNLGIVKNVVVDGDKKVNLGIKEEGKEKTEKSKKRKNEESVKVEDGNSAEKSGHRKKKRKKVEGDK